MLLDIQLLGIAAISSLLTHLHNQVRDAEVIHLLDSFGCSVDDIAALFHRCHEREDGITLGHCAYTDLQDRALDYTMSSSSSSHCYRQYTVSLLSHSKLLLPSHSPTSLSARMWMTCTQALGMASLLAFILAKIRGMWPSGGTCGRGAGHGRGKTSSCSAISPGQPTMAVQ